MPTRTAHTFLRERLEDLEAQHLRRRLRTVSGAQGPWVTFEGRRLLNLSSNNYLGLADHPRLRSASAEAAQTLGVGAAASRLISGSMDFHHALEERLATWKGQEAGLLFTSGYVANLGVISALVGEGDSVFSDALNHASIIDGCRLSKATVAVYPHGDVDALANAVRASAERASTARRLIITDGVFSMDGDIAPLPEIVAVAERFDCLVMVDEAHATGFLGPGGRGSVAHFGLEGRVDVVMGTLSKALGGFGAYVLGGRDLIDYLINLSRPLIFTTALPPPVLGSALAALDLLEEEEGQRLVEALRRNAERFAAGLRRLGLSTAPSETQIVPVKVGEAALALEVMERLQGEGVLGIAIRPPTVAPGSSRVRCSVMATHSDDDLDRALLAFGRAAGALGLVP